MDLYIVLQQDMQYFFSIVGLLTNAPQTLFARFAMKKE